MDLEAITPPTYKGSLCKKIYEKGFNNMNKYDSIFNNSDFGEDHWIKLNRSLSLEQIVQREYNM